MRESLLFPACQVPAFYLRVAPAVSPRVRFDALDQGQSSARSASPALTGLASTYAITEASSLPVRIPIEILALPEWLARIAEDAIRVSRGP